jgi:hypothetical protein
MNAKTVVISLISHTNVGKTALARTLLRQDVGQVEDREHVTLKAEDYPMIEHGELTMRLWDTPGFASELRKRLLSRLEQESNPIGWLLHQVWDRVADKKLWCCQEAIRNIRDEADVVLYLVPADQDPGQVGYVDVEMKILHWIGKPVIVLLNQTGPPKPERDAAEIQSWSRHLADWKLVRHTLALDAFASCWVQERELLGLVRGVLPLEKQEACGELITAWGDRNLAVFEQAAGILGRWLTETAADAEQVSQPVLADHLGMNPARQLEIQAAQAKLQERSRRRSKEATNLLIKVHGLEGDSEGAILLSSGSEHFHSTSAEAKRSLERMLQGAGAGALAGLAVDLPAGGMAFGIPTVIGTIVGALGGLGTAFLEVRGPGPDGHAVKWSDSYLLELVKCQLRVYAMVSHYRRARGPWKDASSPDFWNERVTCVVEPKRDLLKKAWKSRSEAKMTQLINGMLRDLLMDLYPGTKAFAQDAAG